MLSFIFVLISRLQIQYWLLLLNVILFFIKVKIKQKQAKQSLISVWRSMTLAGTPSTELLSLSHNTNNRKAYNLNGKGYFPNSGY